jgi:uncharacterized membrane protein YhaH (DUF805 family)
LLLTAQSDLPLFKGRLACPTRTPIVPTATNDRTATLRPESVMDWVWLLFSFEGRINRAKYWLGSLVMLAWTLLLALVAYAWLLRLVVSDHLASGKLSTDFRICGFGMHFGLKLAGTEPASGQTSVHIGLDQLLNLLNPATYHALSRGDVMLMAVNVAATLTLLWMYLAISIKRLHDRDRSGWWMVPFALLPDLLQHHADALPDSYWMVPLGVAAIVLPIWAFIELGCLKGSPSSNLFGPNPLGKQQARPRSTESRLRATTAYDQSSEIELVPVIGSPPPSMRVKRGHE